MRYTTIIDITDQTALYRNHNARLIYLHLVLKSGYHDNDRDIIDISIRRLSMETGVSVSATRHALRILEACRLVKKVEGLWHVRKWILDEDITPRARTRRERKEAQNKATEAALRAEQEAKEAAERASRERQKATGKTSYQAYIEQLQAQAAAGDLDAQRKLQRHLK